MRNTKLDIRVTISGPHSIAHAADFEPQAQAGFTLLAAQRGRARRALTLAVLVGR